MGQITPFGSAWSKFASVNRPLNSWGRVKKEHCIEIVLFCQLIPAGEMDLFSGGR